MKKIWLILAMLLLSVNINVVAAETPKIVVSGGETMAGEAVDVTVSLRNNPGIISMLLAVDYDSTAMTLIDVKDAGLFGTPYHTDSLSVKPYMLFWCNGTAESDYIINDTVATLTFEVSNDANPGSYPIRIFYDNEYDCIFNYDSDLVDFDVINGEIEVTETQSSGAAAYNTVISGGSSGQKTADAGSSEKMDIVVLKEVSVKINGKLLVFPDQKPIIKDDRTLVPLRAVFQALGATVDWKEDIRTVVSSRGDVSISLAIGSDKLYVNGVAKTIDVPAQIVNDRTMVPIRAIAESFSCTVDWEPDTKTVIITY